MALHLHPDLLPAEHADEPIDQAADAVPSGMQRLPAGQRDEPGGLARKILERHADSPFGARAASRA